MSKAAQAIAFLPATVSLALLQTGSLVWHPITKAKGLMQPMQGAKSVVGNLLKMVLVGLVGVASLLLSPFYLVGSLLFSSGGLLLKGKGIIEWTQSKSYFKPTWMESAFKPFMGAKTASGKQTTETSHPLQGDEGEASTKEEASKNDFKSLAERNLQTGVAVKSVAASSLMGTSWTEKQDATQPKAVYQSVYPAGDLIEAIRNSDVDKVQAIIQGACPKCLQVKGRSDVAILGTLDYNKPKKAIEIIMALRAQLTDDQMLSVLKMSKGCSEFLADIALAFDMKSQLIEEDVQKMIEPFAACTGFWDLKDKDGKSYRDYSSDANLCDSESLRNLLKKMMGSSEQQSTLDV